MDDGLTAFHGVYDGLAMNSVIFRPLHFFQRNVYLHSASQDGCLPDGQDEHTLMIPSKSAFSLCNLLSHFRAAPRAQW